ncbi:MAG: hypothetical protein KTR29_07180 [Rhodothermaceae bacterium]|nr:hypothetical protein [Rhodothermaceae bacterium]
MAKSDDEHKIIKFDELNLLGKLVYVSGVLTRTATDIVQSAVDATSEIITETEKAFKEGLDPNVEDAKIIDEIEEKK